MQRISPLLAYPLYSVAATRAIEQQAQSALLPYTLMQRAGLAIANLACAIAPHASSVWLACGPGNNGGDGLEAAVHLKQRGYCPVVTWLGQPDKLPPDARASRARAVEAGVVFADTPPSQPGLCIDALLGIGSTHAPERRIAQWIAHMNDSGSPILAVDIPTGLDADTGACDGPWVHANHTLSLLTLKPGLFTAQGRDAAGQVWWDALGLEETAAGPTAVLAGAPVQPMGVHLHASHKGTRGDVAVVGGAAGMVGAALLAGSAALHAGAGRVFISLLDEAPLAVNPWQPELMFRSLPALPLTALTVVCGCGGGNAVNQVLPELLRGATHLVLDADALNAIAADTALQALLRQRPTEFATVITPHPLEAARLLSSSAPQVQANRLAAVLQLTERFQCVAVLKGSGTITAAAGRVPMVNSSGNGLLGTGGTGDVLAGLIGARLAAGASAFDAAWTAVFQHGQAADQWPSGKALTASGLAAALR